MPGGREMEILKNCEGSVMEEGNGGGGVIGVVSMVGKNLEWYLVLMKRIVNKNMTTIVL